MSLSANDHIVPCSGQHLFEVRHPGLLPPARGSTTSSMSRPGTVADQRTRRQRGAVGAVAHPEHELERGIILLGERAQVIVERLGPRAAVSAR
jgi:hypothetical protein